MKHSHCPHLCARFQEAMAVLSRPWNGLIVATLEEGPLRFGELAARIEGIGDRMLSARLKELEARGVVERRVEAGPPVRVAYLLTKAGQGFKDVAEAVSRWGEQLEQARGKARPAVAKPAAPDGRKKRAEARAQR